MFTINIWVLRRAWWITATVITTRTTGGAQAFESRFVLLPWNRETSFGTGPFSTGLTETERAGWGRCLGFTQHEDMLQLQVRMKLPANAFRTPFHSNTSIFHPRSLRFNKILLHYLLFLPGRAWQQKSVKLPGGPAVGRVWWTVTPTARRQPHHNAGKAHFRN